MKQTKLLAVAVAVALASAAAFAQTATPRAEGMPRMALDANKDGVIDRAEAAKMPKLAEKFDQLDRNKDGRLSADERPRMGGMRHRGGMRGHGGMRAADTDKDGRISRAEAQAAHAKAGDRFEKMDVNKDGYIDRSDMQARIAQRRSECFAKADADRNGQLSRAEFDRMGEACGRGGMAGRMQKPR
jgi:Ca2+-binding EF-hand superfamily protein